MLTVKLYRSDIKKIVEATEVYVYPCGPLKQKDDVLGICTKSWGRNIFIFYVVDTNKIPEDRWGFAKEVDFWDVAYIENAHGATTEKIRMF